MPVLQVAALDAGALVSGALITETIFARPGMGKLIYDAVMGNDYNLALLALLLVALVTMLATLAADLAQRRSTPGCATRDRPADRGRGSGGARRLRLPSGSAAGALGLAALAPLVAGLARP